MFFCGPCPFYHAQHGSGAGYSLFRLLAAGWAENTYYCMHRSGPQYAYPESSRLTRRGAPSAFELRRPFSCTPAAHLIRSLAPRIYLAQLTERRSWPANGHPYVPFVKQKEESRGYLRAMPTAPRLTGPRSFSNDFQTNLKTVKLGPATSTSTHLKPHSQQ